MKRLALLFNWLFKAWPILVSASLGYLHYYVVTNCNVNVSDVNNKASLALQIIGGLLIVYSIDSNIWTVSNKSIFGVIWNWLISIPIFSKSIVVQGESGYIKLTGYPAKARCGVSTETVEGKMENLQQQINWLKEDLNDEVNNIKDSHTKSEEKFNTEIDKLTELINETDSKLSKVSIGGIKIQVFGIFLMIHGSFSSYYA